MSAKSSTFRLLFVGTLVATYLGSVYPAQSLRFVNGNDFSTTNSDLSDGAYSLLSERVAANRRNFFVYQDMDSGFNHGFPSGFFGTQEKINLNSGCVDDINAANGCSNDPDRLDHDHGTVLSVSFGSLSSGQFAGVNFEEPEGWGANPRGDGYDLRTATQVVFDVRSPTPGGLQVQFGVGGSTTNFVTIPYSSTYSKMSIDLNSLTPAPPNLADAHILFTIVTNGTHAPNGGTLLLNNIRFEPIPTPQQAALGFPLSTQTIGVTPHQSDPFPPDQVNRNITTIYESALTLWALLKRGSPEDLNNANLIAETFYNALLHDNDGDSLPVAPDGSVGLHNGYMSGDSALRNAQGPSAGQVGDVRLAGFSCSVSNTGFCLVLDGATGGNNAFAILALIAAYQQSRDKRYCTAGLTIGRWIAQNLTDATETGFGGYYLGYPDEGVVPKTLLLGKSVENNADLFAAFIALVDMENQCGTPAKATEWISRAYIAGDFVMQMFDPVGGRFYAGTVPVGTPQGPGISPDGPRQGNDTINTFHFLDSNTFTTLALATSPHYRNAIDWRRPIQFALSNFAVTVSVGSQTFQGFNITKTPTSGANGIAWEFTGQMVVAMRLVDRLYQETNFEAQAAVYLNYIRQAQLMAPFGNNKGLVASTIQDGNLLPPTEQCLSTPFQCIPERVGLAATMWAIFADRNLNPLGRDWLFLPLITK
jgi:hypothetical protein